MKIYDQIVTRNPIDKGWSGDRKYCAVTADGRKFLLRISTKDRLERKRREYERMREVAVLGHSLGEGEIRVMQEQAAQVLQWYDGMKNVVPSWYSHK